MPAKARTKESERETERWREEFGGRPKKRLNELSKELFFGKIK